MRKSDAGKESQKNCNIWLYCPLFCIVYPLLPLLNKIQYINKLLYWYIVCFSCYRYLFISFSCHTSYNAGRLGNHFATVYRFLALGYCCKSKLVRSVYPRPPSG